MTFCLDTHCVIWGIKRQGERVGEAQAFLATAKARGDRLIIPAVCVHEMLIRGREEQRAVWLVELERRFLIGAFDLLAADTAARLEAALDRAPAANRYKDRFDIQLVATAIRYGADAILSYDPDLRRIAADHLGVRGFEEPGGLFDVP